MSRSFKGDDEETRIRVTQEVSTHSIEETVGSEPSPPDDSIAGLEVDFEARYERRETLGHGGMGEIHILYDKRIGREVAAKFLPLKDTGAVERGTRFKREARIQGRLEHPSIVPIHDLGIAPNGQLYFTMKRVKGMTLHDILNGLRRGDKEIAKRFVLRRLLTSFGNICITVAFAHEQGVLHRDLKPANVMLGDFGETYVLDWGIARILDPKASAPVSNPPIDHLVATRGGAIVGTPGYMAPEQIGAPESLTPAADIYTLGAILFEILTHERLHAPAGSDGFAPAILSGVDARPSVRAPHRRVAPELEAICVKATCLAPRDRFASARDMHDALERYLDGELDVDRRRAMTEEHVELAEKAARRADEGPPGGEEESRSVAIREVGRALALDPDHAGAMKILVHMLLDPPRTMPKRAAEELMRATERWMNKTDLSVAIAYGSCILSFPLMMWMGVHEWTSVIAIYGLFVALSLASLGVARAKARRSWWIYPRLACAVLAVVLLGRMFGPLFFMPTLFIANAIGAMLSPKAAVRTFAVVTSCVGAALPSILEWGGLLSPSYRFQEGMMCILPDMVELSPVGTGAFLLFANVGLILVFCRHAARTRALLRSAEERSHLYAWHLRQLIPDEVRTDSRARAVVTSASS